MTLENILADFQLLDDWEDRYRYVIELGRACAYAPIGSASCRTPCGWPSTCFRSTSPTWWPRATSKAASGGTGMPSLRR